MSDRPGGEPTEQPTSKRLKEAFKKGEIAYSSKLSGFVVFVVFAFMFSSFIKTAFIYLGSFSKNVFSLKTTEFPLFLSIDVFVNISLLISFFLFLAVLISGFIQVGVRFNPNMLKPSISRISIKKGIQKIFNLHNLKNLLLGILFFISIAVFSFFFWKTNMRKIFNLSLRMNIFEYSGFLLVEQFFKFIAVIIFLFASLDFYLVLKKHKKNLMMTKYEVTKEQRQEEGNPEFKSERRRQHSEILNDNGLNAVKEADVIVINPTRLAIALKQVENDAPIVVAKGKHLTAAAIRKEAAKYDIPVYRDVKLAGELFEIEMGDSIPEELFEPVSLILTALEKWEDYV